MTGDAVQLVRGMFDAAARGDAEAALAAFHPDVEWDGRNIPDGVLGRGHQVIIDHAVHWGAIWDGLTIDIEDTTRVGPDTVIVYTRERGRSKSGVEMDERHAEVYVIRDGLIVRRVGFSDPAEALPAVRAPSWTARTP
jgi:ketosteroid isomerase-like protein